MRLKDHPSTSNQDVTKTGYKTLIDKVKESLANHLPNPDMLLVRVRHRQLLTIGHSLSEQFC